MKKALIIAATALTGVAAQAQYIDVSFIGSFTSGSMNGQEIFGSVSINDLGNTSGTARPLPGALSDGSEGFLDSLSFSFFVPGPIPIIPPTEVTFDLTDASNTPSANFDDDRLFGFSYFGEDGASSLTAFYDATDTDINTAVFLTFNNGGDISQGSLTLPTGLTAVPEPSAYAVIAGLFAIALVAKRPRK